MDKNKKTNKKGLKDPKLMNASEIYDALMMRIEPDLTSKNIDTLDEKYKGESEEDRTIRMEHYQMASFLFDCALEDIDIQMQMDVSLWKKQMTALAQKMEDEDVSSTIQNLEDSIQS